MYALTFCYEGYDDNSPYATTIAVSEDKEKLVEEMNKCILEDTREPDDDDDEDEYCEDCNWSVYRRYDTDVIMQHNAIQDLFATYKIHSVEVL